jgi:hypothetical protein
MAVIDWGKEDLHSLINTGLTVTAQNLGSPDEHDRG